MELLSDALPGLMFLSLIVGLFTGAPVAIMLMGVSLVFAALGLLTGDIRFVQITLLPARIFDGIVQNPVLVAAPMFILMGVVMEKTRIAEDLLMTLQRLLRNVPGGLALAVVLMGTILAAATGIIGASVVMLSLLAIPTMLDRGYDNALAGGTVASAGTLGILIPPSIMLVFMGDLLTINIGRLFVAAFLPGLALAGVYLAYILAVAIARPRSVPALGGGDDDGGSGLWLEAIVSIGVPLLLIVAVLGSVIGGIATPTEASGVGAAAALLLGFLRGRLSLRVLQSALDGSVRTIAMLFFIFVGATAFSLVFRYVGGEHFIVDTARGLNLGDWGLLFTMMLMVFVMGFFFDWIEITLIMLPIFAPLVRLMDLGEHIARGDLIYWFAILVAVNLQTSFLTPPFGFALFYLKGAVGERLPMSAIYRGIIPFVALQVVVLAVLIAWPDLAMWLPRALDD